MMEWNDNFTWTEDSRTHDSAFDYTWVEESL